VVRALGSAIELVFVVRPRDIVEANKLAAPIVAYDDAVLLHSLQSSPEVPTASLRLHGSDPDPFANIVAKMLRLSQSTVDARRGHLQNISRGHDVMHVQDVPEIPTHWCQFVQTDSPLSVEEKTQHGTVAFATVLDVDDLESVMHDHGLGDLPYLLDDR